MGTRAPYIFQGALEHFLPFSTLFIQAEESISVSRVREA
jgi:hypothetical protein